MKHELPIVSDFLRGRDIPTHLLADLPKVDLSIHFDGSLRFSTFVELSRQQGLALPGGSEEKAREILTGASGSQTLLEYIALFDYSLAVLQDAASLRRAIHELVEDCARENVWHFELRFTPTLHTEGELTVTSVTELVLHELHQAANDAGISAGLIISGLRHRGIEEVRELAELAVRYKSKGVVGFDLAGAEANFPAKDHTEAFYLILNNNINCTVHAGEAWGPESIQQALHYLGAHRIGHGARVEEDSDLTHYIADHRIPIEVGLSSSVRTQSVPSLERHPLRRFLRRGLRLTLCSHNRLFLDNSLTHEMRLAVDTFDLTLLDIENLIVMGFKSAFLHQTDRKELLRGAVQEFGEVRRRHGLEGP